MSILIKGMEMPKAGNWKTIRIYYDGTCAEPNWQGDCKYMQGCEAVPVPPHGKLIDADALIEKLRETGKRVFGSGGIPECSSLSIVGDYVESAPTIIPASEEDE
jgi:hypothetical protein